ncbi:hypothetical protein EIB18_04300 [Caulobacter vibrioides]|uniref:Lipoprotein n=2 Tax=Caulobacter vibrioides TaxID=155892 RepID=Q9AA11_CAUVC|nr:hypothetical protein [Caulobacter vibrioides]YP_002516215.1 hypothetical protein CCNA_00842 [Caulobacter vibrioides NA1000]AAK22785.1 hypothetical protein CC_0800 [Caulobacter vibrioides CB15]ACL94307.1 hypothetical protein CCNA_00842 [Caulobacter vibrioides NA1000]ATC27642.1 hypothetical protein CA607_04265 [Caulobacter vibrioides]AZH12011.1 hypothetical protein EIB18_04300 [Caulobacter vibrioides]QXZ52879.1 hypothetical protein KZH45_04170 [Caulobacter vibrioides]
MAWRPWIQATWMAATLALGVPVAALGCSPVQGYVRPSNFELVQIADAIVVAEAIGVRNASDEDFFKRKVVFRVAQPLKGEAGNEIEVSSLSVGKTQPSDPDEILEPHPEAYRGACNRITVAKGGTYVLFLRKVEDSYASLGYPFSRINEDYAGEASPWMLTIRTYLRLQNSEQPMAQLATLERMQAELLAKTTPTRGEQAQAMDIAMHLGAPSPWKPTAYLLAAYDDVKAGRPPRYKPRPSTYDAERSEAAAFTDLIMENAGLDSGKPPPPPRRDPRLDALLEMMIDGEHPGAMPLFDALAASDAPGGDLAMAIRFYAKNGRYRDAYGLIETRAAPLIATLPEGEAWTLLDAIREAQQDGEYDGRPRRWRSQPDLAARWPRLAVALSRTTQDRFGRDADFYDSLMSLLGSDYRSNPELTLMLSGRSNDIIAWAERELVAPANLTASSVGPDDPLRLPMRVILRWMGLGDGDKDVAVLTPMFCRGSAQRQMMFQDIGTLGSTDGAHALLRFAASSVMTDSDRQALAPAISAWDKRYANESNESWMQTDPAMRKAANGQPITAKDIMPLKPVSCAS